MKPFSRFARTLSTSVTGSDNMRAERLILGQPMATQELMKCLCVCFLHRTKAAIHYEVVKQATVLADNGLGKVGGWDRKEPAVARPPMYREHWHARHLAAGGPKRNTNITRSTAEPHAKGKISGLAWATEGLCLCKSEKPHAVPSLRQGPSCSWQDSRNWATSRPLLVLMLQLACRIRRLAAAR